MIAENSKGCENDNLNLFPIVLIKIFISSIKTPSLRHFQKNSIEMLLTFAFVSIGGSGSGPWLVIEEW